MSLSCHIFIQSVYWFTENIKQAVVGFVADNVEWRDGGQLWRNFHREGDVDLNLKRQPVVSRERR